MPERYIVTNFAYGTGPYLRSTELAIAFNDELERLGSARMPVLIPLVYGNTQRQIMREEFAQHDRDHPGELLLDEELGTILGRVFYGNTAYAEALRVWVSDAYAVSARAREYLAGTRINVETLGGERRVVNGKEIAVELNRSPRIRYNVAPVYLTTFGYITEILTAAQGLGRERLDIPPALLRDGVRIAQWVEDRARLRAIAYPATFSGWDRYQPPFADDQLVPPLTSQFPEPDQTLRDPGIFVTITGIPGLERLFGEARELGLALYTTPANRARLPGSKAGPPSLVGNRNIKLQFARAGWGSVWLSLYFGTPLLVPKFDPADDPEIYFNNQMVEELGIGIIYRGEPLEEILARGESIRKNCATLRERIIQRWGTLNGHRVCARMFAHDYVTSV